MPNISSCRDYGLSLEALSDRYQYSRGAVEGVQDEQEEHHISEIACQSCILRGTVINRLRHWPVIEF